MRGIAGVEEEKTMSEMLTFVAEDRSAVGKGAARTLRKSGRVPAVVYGENKDQLMISLEARALRRELQKARFYSTLCALEINGKPVRVLPREIQLHPVSDEPVHADFVYVSKGAAVTVEVPVVFLNEESCPGIKRGGVLNVVRREVELVCPADAIPDNITVDLAEAEISDSLHYSDATVPEGVEPTITDRDFTIATIAAPSGGVGSADDGEDEGEEGSAGEGASDGGEG